MSDDKTWETIFPRDRAGRRTEVTSLAEVRRVMPNIIIGDDIVGIAPMMGPDPETVELLRKLNEKKEQQK